MHAEILERPRETRDPATARREPADRPAQTTRLRRGRTDFEPLVVASAVGLGLWALLLLPFLL